MRDKRVRWAVQADVKKCYESIDRKKLMGFLRHVVKGSPRVLWLIETLIGTHRHGLNIGCKLSQDLVNIYLSVLYHQLTEQVAVVQKRRGEAKSIWRCVMRCSKWMIFFYYVHPNETRNLR